MHKFFVDNKDIKDNVIEIEGEDVKHIFKVLRLKVGDQVVVNNLIGQEFLCELTEVNKKQVLANVIKQLQINNESPVQVDLFQGMPKSTKMDLICQKCTELGINSVTPVMTERVVVENGNWDKKLERWRRITLEACKQSKRTLIPVINEPKEFSELLENLEGYDLVVVPYENKEKFGLKGVFKELRGDNTLEKIEKIAIIIGPEGGFEVDEINKLSEEGCKIVTLGKRILRTETAGFTALSIIMYELGDLGGII